MNGQLHASEVLPPGKEPRYPWIGCWVGPRVGLDDIEKRKFLILLGLEKRPLNRPAFSQWLIKYVFKQFEM
jgi:hypothetical protein